ncbi:MAG: acetyl CoA synthetase, partial [Proteobacteria bacterium]|nr:acetyl CoA synthetase [Pseudomonadota bacterium]
MKRNVFDSFFEPKSVTVFGSIKPGKIGYEITKSMKDGGFQGEIYPINPAGGKVLGYPVYDSLTKAPQKADLAVICLPQAAVVEAIVHCGMKDVKAAVVISSGFSEVGNHEAEKDLVAAAEKWGVRII